MRRGMFGGVRRAALEHAPQALTDGLLSTGLNFLNDTIAAMAYRSVAQQLGAGGGEAPRASALVSDELRARREAFRRRQTLPPNGTPVPSQALDSQASSDFQCGVCVVSFPTREALDSHVAYWHDTPRGGGAA